jgi:hypothetical protein
MSQSGFVTGGADSTVKFWEFEFIAAEAGCVWGEVHVRSFTGCARDAHLSPLSLTLCPENSSRACIRALCR